MAALIMSSISLFFLEKSFQISKYSKYVFLFSVLLFLMLFTFEDISFGIFTTNSSNNLVSPVLLLGVQLLIFKRIVAQGSFKQALFTIPLVLYFDELHFKAMVLLSYTYLYHPNDKLKFVINTLSVLVCTYIFYDDEVTQYACSALFVLYGLYFLYNSISNARFGRLDEGKVLCFSLDLVFMSALANYFDIVPYLYVFSIVILSVGFWLKKHELAVNPYFFIIIFVSLVAFDLVAASTIIPLFVFSLGLFYRTDKVFNVGDKSFEIPYKNNFQVCLLIIIFFVLFKDLASNTEALVPCAILMFFYLFSFLENVEKTNKFLMNDFAVSLLLILNIIGGICLS